jgi:sugar transferase (PEP-CTERM/EpsH1 system associated)
MSLPLIIHLVHRFDVGGLETVLVNLINTLPTGQFRHVIVALTDSSPQMRSAIKAHDVEVLELNKAPGNDPRIHYQLWRLFCRYRPQIVHSYNIATLEYQLMACLAGVPFRIHAEHGRDIYDLDGSNKKYQILRRALNPFIHFWVPVSKELADWLVAVIKIPSRKVKLIYNGIDLQRFKPVLRKSGDTFNVVTVGRMVAVKDQLTLIKAVEEMLVQRPRLRGNLKLTIVGDGDLMPSLQAYIGEHELQDCVRMMGACNDVPSVLNSVDVFVLPSLSEGIALTILEAMASGLPVIATRVGGNPELVEDEINGMLVPSQSPGSLAAGILRYFDEPGLRLVHGQAGRRKAEQQFSVVAMTENYLGLYRKNKKP